MLYIAQMVNIFSVRLKLLIILVIDYSIDCSME